MAASNGISERKIIVKDHGRSLLILSGTLLIAGSFTCYAVRCVPFDRLNTGSAETSAGDDAIPTDFKEWPL